MTETSGDSQIRADLLIVGAGPVGLFGAYYGGVRGLTCVLIDSLEDPGGQITAMYPEKEIFDVAGHPSIKGRDLVTQLVAQAAPHEPKYLLGERATELEHNDESFTVQTHLGTQIQCRAIIVTAGIGTFTPRPLPVGEEYLGRGLVHSVPDPASFAGLQVAVIGGGDSAVDWALLLAPIAESVALVHRRDRFRAHPHSVKQLAQSRVKVFTEAAVTGITGTDWLTSIQVSVAGQPCELPCDRVVAALGFTADLGPLTEWGLRVTKRSLEIDTHGRTNIPGIYAAGDIASYPGKVKLIATGFGEVATAVNNAAAWLNPAQSIFPGHLSDYAADPKP